MTRRSKIAAVAVGGALVLGGGAAFAAKQLDSPRAESDAVIEDAAKRLQVTPAALRAALKRALKDRVDAAVAAGRLRKAEGEALKRRLDGGGVPFFFGGFGHRPLPGPFHVFGPLADAARYLGMSEPQLRAELGSRKTLADVAKAHGKSVSGLVDPLVSAERKHLDAAVAAGRLTKEREGAIVAHLRQRITAFVNGAAHPRFEFRFRDELDRFHARPAWG